MNGLLLVLSGPSGAGKSTICRELSLKCPGLKISTSMTTRPPRHGEREGDNYFFVTSEEFNRRINEGYFLEWAKIYGHYYGTPSDKVEESLNAYRDVLLEIDVQGALQVRHKFPAAVLIFVAPPSLAELQDRIVNRGTEEQSIIEERLEVARKELGAYRSYDYMVINDNVHHATNKVMSIVNAERLRVSRWHELWEERFGGMST